MIGQSISLVLVLRHNLKLLNNNHMTNNPNSNKINFVIRTLNTREVINPRLKSYISIS